LGAASDGLLRLRPVTFPSKKPYDDGSKPVEYGLIAELPTPDASFDHRHTQW